MIDGEDPVTKSVSANIQALFGTAPADSGKAGDTGNAVEKEIKNQEAEWIKYAQTMQRDISDKYDETAKTLVGLFATIFGVFTLLMTFFGLPSSVNVALPIALGAILCFALSILFLVWVIGPRGTDIVNYYDADDIWDTTVRRNITDHRKLVAGILFFIIGIILVAGSIAYSSYSTGETVRIVAPEDKIPSLQNASIAFETNSTLSQEMQLLRRDDKTYTFLLPNGSRVTVTSDWVQAIVTKS